MNQVLGFPCRVPGCGLILESNHDRYQHYVRVHRKVRCPPSPQDLLLMQNSAKIEISIRNQWSPSMHWRKYSHAQDTHLVLHLASVWARDDGLLLLLYTISLTPGSCFSKRWRIYIYTIHKIHYWSYTGLLFQKEMSDFYLYYTQDTLLVLHWAPVSARDDGFIFLLYTRYTISLTPVSCLGKRCRISIHTIHKIH